MILRAPSHATVRSCSDARPSCTGARSAVPRASSTGRAIGLGDDFRSRVTLTCAECETTRVLVATTWAVDAYARRHERQRFQIALALQRAERERMATDAHVLAEALRHDLIGPDDFSAPRTARTRT